MHYGKRFPFVDLLIVTMITYGRLSLSGVVGDHPGETTIRKGRSMNIQLMNVAVDIIEQRLAPLANVLTRNNHITAMRDSFALAMPFVIVGSLLVPILFPPVSIDGASRFGQVYLLLRPILLPTFQLTIGLVALIVAFGASAALATASPISAAFSFTLSAASDSVAVTPFPLLMCPSSDGRGWVGTTARSYTCRRRACSVTNDVVRSDRAAHAGTDQNLP